MKKGIAVIGPTLIFVSLFSLLSTAFSILLGLGLVGGLFFHKKIPLTKKELIAKISIVIILILLTLAGLHWLNPPITYQGLLWGIIPLGIVLSILSWNDWKNNPKNTFYTLLVILAAYTLVAELTLWILL